MTYLCSFAGPAAPLAREAPDGRVGLIHLPAALCP
jgi:hypothetical protein